MGPGVSCAVIGGLLRIPKYVSILRAPGLIPGAYRTYFG